MNDTQDIKEKIAKLMAMAKDDRGNEFECEAALRQATKLMRLHNIDLAEISARTGTKLVYNWSTVNVPLNPKTPQSTTSMWIGSLAVGIAQLTDCKASYNDLKGQFGMCIKLEGDAIDVQYAVYLLKHLRDTIRATSAAAPFATKADRETFRRAMVSRLCERMQAMRAESDAELRRTELTSGGTALVLVSQKIALRDAQFGKARYSHKGSSRYASHSTASAGRSAADKVGFGRPVGSSGITKRLSN